MFELWTRIGLQLAAVIASFVELQIIEVKTGTMCWQLVCVCGAVSKPLHYTQLVHYVTTQSMVWVCFQAVVTVIYH